MVKVQVADSTTGLPIAGASVYVLAPCAPGSLSGTTPQSGALIFDGVPQGVIEVHALAEGYGPGTIQPTLSVNGQTVFVNLAPRAGLFGSALILVTLRDGTPFEGARVTSDGVFVGYTNAYGSVLLGNLNYTALSHTVVVSAEGYFVPKASFEVSASKPHALLHFVLWEANTLNIDRLNRVDAKDLLLLSQRLGTNDPLADFNGDGVVDWKDLFLFAGGWLGDGWLEQE